MQPFFLLRGAKPGRFIGRVFSRPRSRQAALSIIDLCQIPPSIPLDKLLMPLIPLVRVVPMVRLRPLPNLRLLAVRLNRMPMPSSPAPHARRSVSRC